MDPFKETQVLSRLAAERLHELGIAKSLDIESLSKKLTRGPSAQEFFDQVENLKVRGIMGGAVAWMADESDSGDAPQKYTGRNTHDAMLKCLAKRDKVYARA